MIRAVIYGVAFASLPFAAPAQVRCTMPSGVVITQQLSSCPNGATKMEVIDGKAAARPAPDSPIRIQATIPQTPYLADKPDGLSFGQWLAIAAATYAIWWFFGGKRNTRPSSLSKRRSRPVYSAADVRGGPLTNQASSTEALAALLSKAGYARHGRSVLRETLSDFNSQAKEHHDELRSAIEFNKEELANQLEMAESFIEDLEDAESASDKSRAVRRISESRSDIVKLRAAVKRDSVALAEFLSDRTTFVAAYANHVLHDHKSPIKGRSS